jgi:hypothetical protein
MPGRVFSEMKRQCPATVRKQDLELPGHVIRATFS